MKAIRATAKLFLKKGNKQVSAFFEKLEELFNKFKEFLERKKKTPDTDTPDTDLPNDKDKLPETEEKKSSDGDESKESDKLEDESSLDDSEVENFTEHVRNGFKINASTIDDAFKHVDDVTLNGAGKPTYNSNSLVGCHNEVNFNKQLTNNGGRIEIVSSNPSGVNGVKNIEYKTLKLDNQGNPIPGDYVGNGATATKTVYDPNIFPESSMKDLGYKAFKNAMDNPTTKIDVNGVSRTFEGIANGRTISGYYKDVNGEKIISTWWIKD